MTDEGDKARRPKIEIIPPNKQPERNEEPSRSVRRSESAIWKTARAKVGTRVQKAQKEYIEATDALGEAELKLFETQEKMREAVERAIEIANDPSIIGNRVKEKLADEAHARKRRQLERDEELAEAARRRAEINMLNKEHEAEMARREEALKNPQPPKQKGRRRRQSAEQRADQKFREEMENLKETGFVDDWHAEVKRAEAYFMKMQNVTDPDDLDDEFKARLEQMHQAARERKHYKGST